MICLEMHMFLTRKKETPRAQTLHWRFILIALEYASPPGDTTARPLCVIEMQRIRVILYIPSFRSLPLHCLKDNHIALKFAVRRCEKQIFVLLFISSLRVGVFISFFCCLVCFLSLGGGEEKKEVFLKLWDSSTKRITAFAFLSRVMFISFGAGISERKREKKKKTPYFFAGICTVKKCKYESVHVKRRASKSGINLTQQTA